MSGGIFGASGDPFEEFRARFFGAGTPRRPVERVNLARFMSEPARELVRDAAARAAEWDGPDLDTDHLLWAAIRQETTRQMITRANADPDAMARRVHGAAGGRCGRCPCSSRPRPSAPSSTRIGSRGRSARPPSGPSTCCSRWRSTRSPASGTPTLDEYGRDLSALEAREGRVDPGAAAHGDDGAAVPEVTPEDIAEVVSRITGIPVAQLTQGERA